MKLLAVLSVLLLVLFSNGCEGLISDQAADVLDTDKSGADATTVTTTYVSITTKFIPYGDGVEETEPVDVTLNLAIYLDNNNPASVFLRRADGGGEWCVSLVQHGSGEWKADAKAEHPLGTYDKYGSKNESPTATKPSLKLNWTRKRDAIQANNKEQDNLRLEYLKFKRLKDGQQEHYQYQFDFGEIIGGGAMEPVTIDSSSFTDTLCGNYGESST